MPVVQPSPAGIAFLSGLGHRSSDGNTLAAIRVSPGKPVVLAGRADNSLRVLIYSTIVVYFRSIFLLGLRVAATGCYRVQFVSADAAVKNLSTACLRSEIPLYARASNRNRCGPILVADREDRAVRVVRVPINVHFLLRQRGKRGSRVLVLHVVARGDEILASGSEDRQQSGHVVVF